MAEVLGFYYGALEDLQEQSHVWGRANAGERCPHWAFPNLSRSDKSWIQCIAILVSQFQCFHPAPGTNTTGAGIAFFWEKLLWDSEGCFRAGGNDWDCQCLPNLKGSFEEHGGP